MEVQMHESAGWSQLLLGNRHSVIKSPRSGVTLGFQFVSVSAAAMTFASHVKTVLAKP